MLQAMILAFSLLTRLPVQAIAKRIPLTDDSDMAMQHSAGQSLLFYPLVGAVIGGLLMLVQWLLGAYAPGVAAALVLALWVMLTGALHLDGLADCCDASVGGMGNKQRAIEILKDPCSGPMGVSAVVVVLLLKYALLIEILALSSESSLSMMVLFWSPVLARTLVIGLFLTLPYIHQHTQKTGMASAIVEHLPRTAAWQVIGLVAVVLFLHWGGQALLCLALFAGLLWWFRRAALRIFGGFGGDVAGASIEITELLVLLFVVL